MSDTPKPLASLLRVLGIGFAIAVAGGWLALILVGARDLLGLTDPVARMTGESEDIRNLAQAFALRVAAMAGLVAAPLVLYRAWILDRQRQAAERQAETAAAQAETAQKGHITDRFSKAIEQLGNEQMATRLGAIYALEQVARDEVTYHIPIMETLCAFIRENANRNADTGKMREPREFPLGPLPKVSGRASEKERALHLAHIRCRGWEGGNLRQFFGSARPLRADVQAAFAVIGRRGEDRRTHEVDKEFSLDFRRANFQSLDVSTLDLARADLRESRLEGANLREAQMEGANLREARMQGAFLVETRMEGANLRQAQMEGADLTGAQMEGADLWQARMEGANLSWARMEGSDLSSARMEGAVLVGAWLKSTNLSDCSIARMSLIFVDFTEAEYFDPDSINEAFGVKAGEGLTKLPEGVPYPEHWHDATEDGSPQAYDAAYKAWLAGTGKGGGTGA
ncbi:MAG: pentapeptide repeat-containing protein [Pseudomonadota bacterium]